MTGPCERRVACRPVGFVLLGAGAAILYGSTLPWITALDGVLGFTGTGVVGDGWLTLLLALVVLLAGALTLTGHGTPAVLLTLGLLPALASIGVAAYEVHRFNLGGPLHAALGPGLPVVTAAAGLALGAVVVGYLRRVCADDAR